MPVRRLECPACDWSFDTFMEPEMFPVICPKCGCPVWHYAEKAKAAGPMLKWKVYLFVDPSLFCVVEWPKYDLEQIKGEAIRASEKFSRRDYPLLGVRRYKEAD